MLDNKHILIFNSANKHFISFLPKKSKKTDYAMSARSIQQSIHIIEQQTSQYTNCQISHKFLSQNSSVQLQPTKNQKSSYRVRQRSLILSRKNQHYQQNKIQMKFDENILEKIDKYFKKYSSLEPVVQKIDQKYNKTSNYCKKFIKKEINNSTIKCVQKEQYSLKINSQRISPSQAIIDKAISSITSEKICKNIKNSIKYKHNIKKELNQSKLSLLNTIKPVENSKNKGPNLKQLQLPFKMKIRKPKKQYFAFGLSDCKIKNQNKLEIYRDFLWKVNYSNGLYVQTPEQSQNYKVFIGKGNNSQLIQIIMRRRHWWSIADKIDEEGINFYWTQLKIDNIFERQVSSSQSLYQQIQPQKLEELFETYNEPISKIFGNKDYNTWKHHLAKFGKFQQKINEQTYYKRIHLFYEKKMSKIDDSTNLLIHNHLSDNYYIGNKKALFYNLRHYYKLLDRDPFTILPRTFHIQKGIEDPQYQLFLAEFRRIQEMNKQKQEISNVWIVKPGENTNRGHGITICYTIDDIEERFKNKQKNTGGKIRTFILQKYIQNPLLYNKRKFDIRHYLLITCINEQYKAYWYQQGYIRTSSNQFTLKNNKDPLVHLTNDAIQQNSSQYGKFEKSNKISYSEFSKYINKLCDSNKQKKYSENYFQKVILTTMKNYALQAIRATFPLLDVKRKKHNFELLGFDFMIDQDLKPWLIEVNTNPCLETPCALLEKIIPALIQNTIRICIDPLFPPPQNWPINKKMYISENTLQENRFQLIFDEKQQIFNLNNLYCNSQRYDKKMGDIAQDPQIYFNEEKNQNTQKIVLN